MIKRPMNEKDVVKYTRDILRRRKKYKKVTSVFYAMIPWKKLHLSFYCSLVVSRLFTIGIQWEELANIFQKLLIAKNSFSLPLFLHGNLYGGRLVHL